MTTRLRARSKLAACREARHAAIRAAEAVPVYRQRELIRGARGHLNMTPEELAEAIGMAPAAITRAEGGGVVYRGAWLRIVELCASRGLHLVD